MRFLLIEAGGMAGRKPGPLRDCYRRMVRQKSRAKAWVAVARKLEGIVYHLWKQDLDYRGFLELETQKRVSH